MLPSLTINDLEKAITVAADAYYTGKPIISDHYYDILIDKLRNRDPKNSVLSNVGSVVGAKVKLPYWMGSMDKIKTETKVLDSWLDEYHGPYLISDKLDGISGLLVVKNKRMKLYTRGNGEYGKDITHLIPDLKIPKLTKDIAIRGELIMSKADFTKYASEMANARSLVAGVANSNPDNVNQRYIKDIKFMAYEIIDENLIPSDQFKQLKKYRFAVPHHVIVDTISIDELFDMYDQHIQSSAYDIDGLIVTDNNYHERNIDGNPAHSFAYKGPSETADVKVIDVIWTPSMYGILVPRVRFEPIYLSQATLEYASGFNARFIVDSGIGPGAIITIVRSGGVIPDILDTKKPVKAKLPGDMEYEWDKNEVNIMLTRPGDNVQVLVKILTKFVRVIGAEGVSEGIIDRLVKAGYFTIQDIIGLTVKDIEKIPGFKTRSATKVYDAIQGALERLDILTLMVASNQFGKGFAHKNLKKILDVYPNIVNEFDPKQSDTWRNRIASIEGFGTLTADMFVAGLKKFQQFYQNLDINVKPYEPLNKTGDRLAGEVIVFTGIRAPELIPLIEAEGGRVSPSANSKTTIVVYGGKSSASSKYAQENNLPLLTKSEFIAEYLS